MSRYIKIAAICGIFFTTSAFAHGHGGHGGYGYEGYGYRPYYGGVYIAPVAGGYYPQSYYAAPQPYYAQPQAYNYGYAQQAPMYGQYR